MKAILLALIFAANSTLADDAADCCRYLVHRSVKGGVQKRLIGF